MAASPGKLTLFDKHVFQTFVRPGEVVEVRIPHVRGKAEAWSGEYARGTVSGYYHDHEAFCKAVKEADKLPHSGIYFSLQVIDSRLLARAYNRLKIGGLATSDSNVIGYRWLPIDIDPVRPAGVASSDSEIAEALQVREQVEAWIADNLSFGEPLRAFSGNGWHLLYRLPDIESTPRNRDLVKGLLEQLDTLFSTSRVSIDTTVFNPARIWKLYGTTARKGDEIPSNPYLEPRPHRMAYIESLGVTE